MVVKPCSVVSLAVFDSLVRFCVGHDAVLPSDKLSSSSSLLCGVEGADLLRCPNIHAKSLFDALDKSLLLTNREYMILVLVTRTLSSRLWIFLSLGASPLLRDERSALNES